MTDEQTKQAILGFTEFFKGITGNQNLEIPSEIAEKYGIQTQADGEYILKSEAIKAIRKDIMGGLNYESILRDMPSVSIPSAEPCEDAISRQALLDDFGFSEKTRKWGGDHSGYNTMMLYEIQDMIESAPSVKPQESKIVPIAEVTFDDDKLHEIVEEAVKNIEIEPKWIPVSERLPEKNMPCLVSAGKLLLTQIAIYSDLMGTIDHRIFYQGDYGHENFVNITEYVKAWMPLPKPYETQERSK